VKAAQSGGPFAWARAAGREPQQPGESVAAVLDLEHFCEAPQFAGQGLLSVGEGHTAGVTRSRQGAKDELGPAAFGKARLDNRLQPEGGL
jgi:hypothetical protein